MRNHLHFAKEKADFWRKVTLYSWNHRLTRVNSWFQLAQAMKSLEWGFWGNYVKLRLDILGVRKRNVVSRWATRRFSGRDTTNLEHQGERFAPNWIQEIKALSHCSPLSLPLKLLHSSICELNYSIFRKVRCELLNHQGYIWTCKYFCVILHTIMVEKYYFCTWK